MNNKILKNITISCITAFFCCGIALGQSVSNKNLLMQWKCNNGNTTLNFNQAHRIDNPLPTQNSTDSMSVPSQNAAYSIVFDSVPYAKDYTTIIVSKPLSSQELPLWELMFDDSISRGLTTQTILCGSSSIRYTENTKTSPSIFTLSQTAPDCSTPFAKLKIGGASQEIAVIRYYNNRMSIRHLRKVQSELAIRYGITLGPVDYLRGDGTPVWNHAQNVDFHHRITALATDSSYGLQQLKSRSEMENPVLTISTDSMPEGSYLVIGDNDAPLEFLYDSVGEMLSRAWLAQATGNTMPTITLAFDKSAIPLPNDSIVLVVDDAVYRPSANAGGVIAFSGVQFPDGISHLALARGSYYWLKTRSKKSDATMSNSDKHDLSSVRLFPNPTTGRYIIDLTNCGTADITIFNALGETILKQHVDGSKNTIIKGFLPIGGEYYVTVSSADGIQTFKLIVTR